MDKQPKVEPNILDRIIGYVSPQAGFRRQRARIASAGIAQIQAQYAGAKLGRGTGGWLSSGASANAEISRDLVKLRERSRALIRDDWAASNAQAVWRTLVVGYGIQPQWSDARMASMWSAWERRCSADNLPSWAALLSQVCGAEFESGEVLIRRRWRRRTDGVWPPFQIQILESDYLDNSLTRQTENGGYIIQGVEHNQYGQIVAYWLFGQHPGEVVLTGFRGGNSLTSAPVPAADVIHHYDHDAARPGQKRGVPRLHAVMRTIYELGVWEEAELLRKATEACIALVIEAPPSENPSEWFPQVTGQDGSTVSELSPGLIVKTQPGETGKFNQPVYAGGYSDYKASRCRDIAAGTHQTYELQSGDYSKSNYSSARMGAVHLARTVEAHQWTVFIPRVCDGIAQWFIDAVNMFDGPAPPALPVWTPCQFNLLDRLNEAQANQLELQTGQLTYPQMVSAQGENPETQAADIEQWAPRLKAAGVDFFGGKTAQVQPDAQPQQTGGQQNA